MKEGNIFLAAAGSGLVGVTAPTNEEFTVVDPTNRPNYPARPSRLQWLVRGRSGFRRAAAES